MWKDYCRSRTQIYLWIMERLPKTTSEGQLPPVSFGERGLHNLWPIKYYQFFWAPRRNIQTWHTLIYTDHMCMTACLLNVTFLNSSKGGADRPCTFRRFRKQSWASISVGTAGVGWKHDHTSPLEFRMNTGEEITWTQGNRNWACVKNHGFATSH